MGILSGLLELLFPPRCVFCRRILRSGASGVCPDCEQTLPRTQDGGRQSGDYYTVCVAPLYYEGVVRDSILRYKFKDHRGYAKAYGRFIAGCVSECLAGKYDIISWVPLSEQRLKSRGYDQAMLLALSAALELGDVAVETLVKSRDVPAQSRAGDEDKRRENISGAFDVRDAELIRDRRVLLIDDIVTTGSTLSECSRTLLQAGAAEVLCAALASTK